MRAIFGREFSGIMLLLCGMTLLRGAIPAGTRHILAEFETGARKSTPCASDFMVGSRKEISRFQILPSVWTEYSDAQNYQDPNAAWRVTVKILHDREETFRRATGREWDPVDLYLMWNAPGVYQRARWDCRKVSRAVLERAKRFRNLFEERTRIDVAQTTPNQQP